MHTNSQQTSETHTPLEDLTGVPHCTVHQQRHHIPSEARTLPNLHIKQCHTEAKVSSSRERFCRKQTMTICECLNCDHELYTRPKATWEIYLAWGKQCQQFDWKDVQCDVSRRASLYAERSPNKSFHSVILCDYRSGCPYSGNGRDGERRKRRSEVTEVSGSSGCTVWSAARTTMATLKRHICFYQSGAASHQVFLVCDARAHACLFSAAIQPHLMR